MTSQTESIQVPELGEHNRSWLVQRLDPPPTRMLPGFVDNPFSFGGGMKNGGLGDEAMSLIRQVWEFDYMGAAEFEFGDVPAALSAFVRWRERMVAFSIQIPLSKVQKSWRDAARAEPKPEEVGTVYVLCPQAWREEVVSRIKAFAAGTARTKEYVGLSEALRPSLDEFGYKPRTCGWLEIDNGYMFFTDKTMWSRTRRSVRGRARASRRRAEGARLR